MGLYLFLLALALLNCIFNKKDYRIINYLLFFVLFFITAFRAENIGTDTQAYIQMYELSYEQTEILFNLLIKFIHIINGPSSVFILACAVLFYLPLLLAINIECKKNARYAILLLMISTNIYFIDSFNNLRQCISVSFLLLALTMFKRDRKYLFYFLYFVAVGFHTSTLLYIPFIYLTKLKINRNVVIITILLTLIMAFSLNILTLLPNDLAFVSSYFDDKLSVYKQYGVSSNFNGLVTSAFFFSVFSIYSFINTKGDFYSKIFYFGAIITNIFSSLSIIRRVSMGFIIVELFLFSMLMESKSNKVVFLNKVILLILIVYYIYMLNVYSIESSQSVIPYKLNF